MKARPAVCATILALALGLIAAASTVQAQERPAPERASQELTSGWRFNPGDAAGAERPAFDDSAWAPVTTPHTWNRVGGTVVRGAEYNSRRGPGWYRYSFTPPAAYDGKKVWLQFDGASITTEVWLNGVRLGQHKGAFARFRFDATPALKLGQSNVLAVKTDNSSAATPGSPNRDIIPITGDFFMFGGLYRRVSMIATDPVHIDMLDWGGPGIYARTLSANAQSASVEVTARVANDTAARQDVVVRTAIIDAAGIEVAAASLTQAIDPAKTAIPVQTLSVPKPRLWNGRADPYLYRFVVTVSTPQGKVLDTVTQPLGIRTFFIDPNEGFILNGKPIPLRGAARHQDRPVKGWVISEADQREDLDLLLELGANTTRLAHYQHDQAIFDMADAAGLAVWAEIPLVNRAAPPGADFTTPALKANTEDQLRELIAQNYNHPSVITWSIGNEVNNAAKKRDGVSHARPLLEALNTLAKTMDPSRPTSIADCCETETFPEIAHPGVDDLARITDVVAYNRYEGWYYNTVDYLGPLMDRLHRMHPQWPIAVGEFGSGAALTQHTDNPLGGHVFYSGSFHPEEYGAYMHETWWAQLKTRPYLWATWIWNLADFSSDERVEGDMIDTNNKGLVSYDRSVRKDVFYFYKANWGDQPVLHLTGRRYADRAYQVMDVKAYSNAASARLTLGGRDLGIAACPDHICLWKNVRLSPGSNVATVTADIGGRPVTDTVTWTYTGAPGTFRIRAGSVQGLTTAAGVRYGSDNYFIGGDHRYRKAAIGNGVPDPANPPVDGAADQALFSTWREGAFSYAVPVPNGRYRVTLKFFEPQGAAPGSRVFDVAVNGRRGLRRFDVAAAVGGPLKAVERTLSADVKSGVLTIDFKPVTGKAVVSAIEIEPVS